MNKKDEKILRENLGLSEEEFERLKKEKVILEEKEERPAFVSTNTPIPPDTKKKILTTHELDADGKLKGQRFWDKEKTLKKPAFVTGDVALSESEEGKQKRAEVMEEIRKSKEKKG